MVVAENDVRIMASNRRPAQGVLVAVGKLGCPEQLRRMGHSPQKLMFTAWRTCSVNFAPEYELTRARAIDQGCRCHDIHRTVVDKVASVPSQAGGRSFMLDLAPPAEAVGKGAGQLHVACSGAGALHDVVHKEESSANAAQADHQIVHMF